MKKYNLFALILTLTLCIAMCSKRQDLPSWFLKRFESEKLHKKYKLASYLEPSYYHIDLTGDGEMDIAALIENDNGEKGMVIINHGNGKPFVLGAGKDHGLGTKDISWADFWIVFEGGRTYQMNYDDQGVNTGFLEMNLPNKGIHFERDEGGGGLIYWTGKKYIWMNQGVGYKE